MARTSPEAFTENHPTRAYKPLDMTNPQAVRPMEVISQSDAEVLTFAGGLPEELKFNEEVMDIRIEPRSERNAPKTVDVTVNGDRRWLPVGVPISIQRKFVAVLAGSLTVGITTEQGTAQEENPRNVIHRNPFRTVPFSVLRDPNPRGQAWLNKLCAEA